MAFDNTGIYTGPTGAINAAPGDIIRSATWNTINIAVAAALTQLAQQSFTSSVVTKTANYTIASTDNALIINQTTPCTLVMPTASTNVGRWLRIKSVSLAVVASATVVVAQAATTPGVTIVSTTGKWAALTSDGSNWVVMMSN